jgi:maltooligosyltrehalose trehalohydrolase
VTSRLDWAELSRGDHLRRLGRYRRLLAIRTREIVPRLAGIPPFAGDYRVLGVKAVLVQWQLGDRSQLVLVANFADERVPIPPLSDGRLHYSSADREALPGSPLSAVFFLKPPAPG